MSTIRFNKPYMTGNELDHIAQAYENGILAGNGPFTVKCQQWIENRLGCPKALLTHSCTAALEMSAILANIGPGDEVIVPSFTFVSTANAFAIRGAKIVFVDIRPDTLNIDETRIEQAITPKTKAIVPVHYAGIGCEMDRILAIARDRGLAVIEDAAHAVNATYKGRHLGTLGDIGVYSFHETKNLISGEGGAISINNPKLFERAEIVWEKGTDRAKFFRGEVDKYTWVDFGSSFLPSELTASFLFAQLEMAEAITTRRLEIFRRYENGLSDLMRQGQIILPYCPDECKHDGHMFYLRAADNDTRNDLIDYLRERDIHAVFHYIPLHSSPMGRMVGRSDGALPVTDDVSGRLLRLPCHYELSPGDQDRVIDAVSRFFTSTRS